MIFYRCNTVIMQDASVGVNFEDINPKRTRTFGTMTNKVEQVDKGITARLCCEEDGVRPRPAVEFIGDQFNFQSALETSVAGLGIKFMDFENSEI